MRNLYLILFLLLFSFTNNIYSQTSGTDNLLIQLENHSSNDSIRVKILNNLALQYSNIDLQSSILYANQALELSILLNYEHGTALSYFNLGLVYRKRSEFDSSLTFLEESLKIFEELEDLNGQIKCLHQISIIYNSKADFLTAIQYLYNCLEISKSTNDLSLLSDIYNSLSTNYNRINNQKKALEFVRKSNSYDILLKDSFKINRSLNNIGYYYLRSDSLEKAQDFYFKSLYLSKKLNNKSTIGYNYYGLAVIYDKLEIYDTALTFYTNAIKSFKSFGNKQMEGQTYTTFGNHYYLLGKIDSAMYFAEKGLKISELYDDVENLKNTYKLMLEIYALKKDFKNAFDLFFLYKSMQDSLQKTEIIQNLTINELEYNFKLTQQHVDFEQQSILSRQKAVKNYFIAAFITALIIVFLISYILFLKTKKNTRLKKANETRDQMFKIISHDFRSPLISISNTLQLIPELIKKKDYESAIRLSVKDEQSVSQVLSLIDSLINWTLSQNDDIPYNPEKYKLYEISLFIFNLYTPVASYKNINLKNNIPADLEIFADKNILNTVLRNLINNAIKFTLDNGLVTVTAKEKTNQIEISVSDNGIGIPKERLKDIFNVEKDKTFGTEGEKGSGLGLFFCKEFALKNKGDLWVESELDKGSTFYFTVPKSD
ncbi:ATP-binding protein [Bacteroidota bacterium]